MVDAALSAFCVLLLPSTNMVVQRPDTTLELLSGDRKLQLAVQVMAMMMMLVLHLCWGHALQRK
jgi:hypothetical protein